MSNLEKISKAEANKMARVYQKQEKIIKDKLQTAIERGNDTTYLKQVQSQINKEIKVLQVYTKEFSGKRLKSVYDKQSEVVDATIEEFDAKFDVTSSFGRVDDRAIQILAENTSKNYAKVNLAIGRQSQDFLRKVGLKATSGVVFGSDTWQQAARNLTKELKANNFMHVKYKLKDGGYRNVPAKAYAQMVARTTTAEAHRLATSERIQAWGYDLVDVIGHSRFPESPCIPYQGKTLSLSGKTEGYISLESARSNGYNHPNCLIPDTNIISDRVISSYTRWYEGKVILIRTTSGEKLTVTPNHPVLTKSGWIKAQFLSKGDEVIKCVDSNIFTDVTSCPNNIKINSIIQDIASSFTESSQMLSVSVPISSKDFHGDVIDENICIINTDISLLNKINTVFPQEVTKSNFISRNVRRIINICFSPFKFLFNSISTTTISIISFFSDLFASIIRHKRISQFNTFCLAFKSWYASISQKVLNNRKIDSKTLSNTTLAFPFSETSKTDFRSDTALATFRLFKSKKKNSFSNFVTRNAESFSEFLVRISAFVTSDKIISVEVINYCGHVYNLHTFSGFYVANNILTHNCIHSNNFSEKNLELVK